VSAPNYSHQPLARNAIRFVANTRTRKHGIIQTHTKNITKKTKQPRCTANAPTCRSRDLSAPIWSHQRTNALSTSPRTPAPTQTNTPTRNRHTPNPASSATHKASSLSIANPNIEYIAATLERASARETGIDTESRLEHTDLSRVVVSASRTRFLVTSLECCSRSLAVRVKRSVQEPQFQPDDAPYA
jgi:hypothetical protein